MNGRIASADRAGHEPSQSSLSRPDGDHPLRGFTPGPWKALIHETLADAKEDSGFTWLESEAAARRFLPLGCVWRDTGRGVTGLPGHVETTAANARLIAAAPDMFEALDELLNYSGGADSALEDEYVVARAIAALAKARGRQP
jgi:hypothetical protein